MATDNISLENLVNVTLLTEKDIGFKKPEPLERFEFFFVKQMRKRPSKRHSCCFEEALEAPKDQVPKLLFMITGAIKAMKNPIGKIIVLDVQTPLDIPDVKLYVNPASGNWHFDLPRDQTYKFDEFEEVNPLRYVYFQSDEYFLALRKTENCDIIVYVYKKPVIK